MTDARRQRLTVLLLFLVPGMAYLILVRILPAVFTLVLSFSEWSLKSGKGPSFVGFRNFQALAADQPFLESILRTVFFTVVATGIELALGLAIALYVNREFRGKSVVRAALLTPMVITPAVVGLIWYILFHPAIGPLNYFLESVGLEPVQWLTDPGMALWSVILADVWHWTPFTFLLCLSGLQMIPQELYEGAAVDGATRWQSLRFITLPSIRDTLIVAAILRGIQAFEIFAEPFVMTGGGPGRTTETLSLHIYKSAFLFFEMGYAGAMILVSILMLAGVYAIYLRYVRFD